MSRSKIRIQTAVAGQPQKVWEYWTHPEHIIQWNFASDDWHCPSVQNDLKVGGKYLARMEAKDKSYEFDFLGIYTEIDLGKKLVYVIDDGRTVETSFQAEGDAVVITTIFEAEDIFPEETQRNGWQAILDNFRKYVESI